MKLPGIHPSSLVSINTLNCFTNCYFLRVLSCFKVKGYIWRNSGVICPNPVFSLAPPMTVRSIGVKQKVTFSASEGVVLMDHAAALR